jgi:hypothetical protein
LRVLRAAAGVEEGVIRYPIDYTGLTISAWTDSLNRAGFTETGRGTPVSWALEAVRVAADSCYRKPASRELGQAYVDANLPVLRLQLYRAGVRLAGFLNAIFDRAGDR